MKVSLSHKRLTFLFVFLFAFIFAGCSKDKGGTPGVAAQMPPAPVKVYKVEAKDTPYYETYIAQAEGSRAVEVRAQVSGILKTKNYEAGRYINAGDLMFTIEPDTYQAMVTQAQGTLAQANARLIEARQNYDRTKNLYKESAVSQKDYDTAVATFDAAKATVESAKAALSDAQIKLGYTYVTAPVSGYASKANFSEGNLISVSNTTPLTVVNTVDPIYVNFAIPASSLNSWRNMAAAGKMRIDNYTVELILEDGSVFGQIGDVIFLDKRVEPTTGDIQARAEFKNPNTVVLPGQYVKAKLIGNTLVKALIIPQKAVLQLKTGPVVITVDKSGKAEYKPITLGMNLGNDFLVDSGLSDGDTIIVEGVNKVMNGATVRAIDDNPVQNMPQGAPGQAGDAKQQNNGAMKEPSKDNSTNSGATAK